MLKFINSEKAQNFAKSSPYFLSYVVPVKIKVKILQNFVAYSEYRTHAIISCGLYIFYPISKDHLCTVTFGLMYGLYSRAASNQEWHTVSKYRLKNSKCEKVQPRSDIL